jgi:Zn finger protein HypA/HybF involved in hydrogenase expression
MSKVFCPKCGSSENISGATYPLEDERESFEDSLGGFDVVEDEVIIPKGYLEAGPYNGDRFLLETEVKVYDCRKCNCTFAVV